jgi:1-deoxy-D-xylulose-5-phosphate reductoisomerase
MPAVLNAANEVAVDAFLRKRVGFMDIPRLIAAVMAKHRPADGSGLDEILEADAWARQAAADWIEEANPGQ